MEAHNWWSEVTKVQPDGAAVLRFDLSTTSGGTVPTYGQYTPAPQHPGVGGSKNKRRPTRRARPKKSQR